MSKELLTQSHAVIVGLQKRAQAAEAAIVTVKAEAAKAVAAAQKTASTTKADLAPLAKTAVDALFDKGLFATREIADKFASEIANSPENALKAIQKIAAHVAKRPGTTVVKTASSAPETADDAWARHVQNSSFA